MTPRVVYWHRDLPPLTAEMVGAHTIEAISPHVPGTLAHRTELWDRCYEDLMEQARVRLEQETARMGGTYAHVFGESNPPAPACLSGDLDFSFRAHADR